MLVPVTLDKARSLFLADNTYCKDFYFGVKNTDEYYTTKEETPNGWEEVVRVDRGQTTISNFLVLATKSLWGSGIYIREEELS